MTFSFILKTEFPVRSYSNVLELLTIYTRIGGGVPGENSIIRTYAVGMRNR